MPHVEFLKIYALFQVFFNHISINKITSRIRCTSTQDVSWENPHGGEKPNKPFPYIKVSSNNVNDVPWHASGKNLEGEGNVPRARTYPTEKSSSQGALNQKQKCATKERDRTKYKMMNHYE